MIKAGKYYNCVCWICHTKQNTIRLSLTFKADFVYEQPTCRSYPKHSKLAISFLVLRRPLFINLPWIWSWVNSIWKGQVVASGKWWDADKEEKPSLKPRLLTDRQAESRAIAEKLGSFVSVKQECKQAEQGRYGKCHNTNTKLTKDLIVREVRLFKEKMGYMKTIFFATHCKASLSYLPSLLTCFSQIHWYVGYLNKAIGWSLTLSTAKANISYQKVALPLATSEAFQVLNLNHNIFEGLHNSL